jgi:hypothetical protein
VHLLFRRTALTPRRTMMVDGIRAALIAPFGMNCRLCRVYTRENKAWPGCRGDDGVKAKTCATCRIKNCEKIVQGGATYCFSCYSFPCVRLKRLDKLYRARDGMSMVDNLENTRKFGIRHFIATEKVRRTCSECGEIICVHKPQCLSCEHKWP